MFNRRGAQVLDSSLAARAYAAVELDDSPLLFPSSYSSYKREKHLERDFAVMEMRAACSCNVGKLIESIELVTIQSVCFADAPTPFHLVNSILIYILLSLFHFPCHFWMFVCLCRRSYRPVFFFSTKICSCFCLLLYYSPAREFISLPFHYVARECHFLSNMRSGNFFESEKLLRCWM